MRGGQLADKRGRLLFGDQGRGAATVIGADAELAVQKGIALVLRQFDCGADGVCNPAGNNFAHLNLEHALRRPLRPPNTVRTVGPVRHPRHRLPGFSSATPESGGTQGSLLERLLAHLGSFGAETSRLMPIAPYRVYRFGSWPAFLGRAANPTTELLS